MAVVDPSGLSSVVVDTAADGPDDVAPPGGVRPARGLGRLGPIAVVVVCGLFFILPLVAMARFSLQNVPMVRLGWSTLFDNWSFSGITNAFNEPEFRSSLYISLRLALGTVVLTLALLLPTTLWVHLRLPKARPFVEFLTVLPYVIPPIALVAGILPLQPHARWFLNSDYSLIPFYTVLALPFTFRAIDAGVRALDVKTLVDASRSLGAGWGTTLLRVMIPNLRTAIVASSFLTAAVVLGEFTIASVLLKQTLQPFVQEYQQREPQGGMGLGLVVILFTTGLFAFLSLLTRKRGAAAPATTVF
jgi:putative spermidine/putrescine transport system permease protein